MIKIVDCAISNFAELRSACDSMDYSGVVNPVDGVLYPGISDQVPASISDELVKIAEEATGKSLSINSVFFRLTVKGEAVPHEAHNDRVMGDYGLILYMNRDDDCKGGTSFVTHHRFGMAYGPENAEQEAAWSKDVNVYDAWNIYKMVEMRPNRAFLFDASLMHRAEAPNNFGSSASNGRLALITFFRES